jgi:hypothetical protein
MPEGGFDPASIGLLNTTRPDSYRRLFETGIYKTTKIFYPDAINRKQ